MSRNRFLSLMSFWRTLLTLVTWQVLMFGVPLWPAETLCGFAVALTDVHLTFVVFVWRREITSYRRWQSQDNQELIVKIKQWQSCQLWSRAWLDRVGKNLDREHCKQVNDRFATLLLNMSKSTTVLWKRTPSPLQI